MRDFTRHPMIGKWRIIGMELWESCFIDLLGPGYIEFDAKGGGAFAFGAVEASLDCSYGPASIHVNWNGSDEGDQVAGDGFADNEEDGTIGGEIRYHNGDESSLPPDAGSFSATC